jgi:F-type H+-transporting ATPase subunit delta
MLVIAPLTPKIIFQRGTNMREIDRFSPVEISLRPRNRFRGFHSVAADTSIASGVAGRYATALFDLAKEADALDSIAQDLQGLKALLNDSDDLSDLVNSPLYSRDQQGAAMDAVLDSAGAQDLTRRFVGVITQNRRLFVIADIIDAYRALLSSHRGEMDAEVISSRPLSDAQLEALRGVLANVLRAKVIVETSVDDTLLGGLVVRVGSRMIDSSLRTKLENMQLAMKGVG